MSLQQNRVGPASSNASLAAGLADSRAGNMGDLISSQLQPRYYEGTYRKARFNAANSAGVTTTVGVATTYVGICLSNPISSAVNLVLGKIGFSFLVAFTAASALGIMTGFNGSNAVSHTTPLVPKNSFIGSGVPAPTGAVDSACTLPTAPTVDHIFAAGLTGAITTEPIAASQVVDLEGSIILGPGGYAAFFTSTAGGTSSFWGSLDWTEVPV